MKEGVSFGAEDNSGSTSSSKKKKNLGHVAAESSGRGREERRNADKAESPRRSLFDSFEPKETSKPDTGAEKPAKVERLSSEPVAEAEAPLEDLSEQAEKPAIVQELAAAGEERVASEITDGSDEAEAAKAVAHELYAAAQESGDPDKAYAEALATAGVSAEELDESIESEKFADAGELIIDRSAENDTEADSESDAENVNENDAEAAKDDDDGNAGGTGGSSTGGGSGGAAAGTAAAGGASGGGSGHSGGGAPPHGPTPPFGHGGPGGPGGYGAPGGPPFGGGYRPAMAPMPVNRPSMAPRAPEYDTGNPAAAALVGGIIGYLIGRRRGRIKTEKKLLPIQKKLEKQVVNLDWQLREKESQLRRIATEQVRTKGAHAAEQIRQRAAERQELRLQEKSQSIERRPAPEAHHLHGSKRQQEHIGHMLLAAEAPLIARQAKSSTEIAGSVHRLDKSSEISPEAVTASGKRVETLNRAELMSLSEKIIVDGSSLRQIYESHLIGERGLRRLVGEHLRGGDLKKALRQEVVEREIDFERDPAMRDLAGSKDAPVSTGGGKAALDSLLQKAEAGLPSGNEEAAFFKARARYESVQHEQEQKQRRLIDISLTAIIMTLVSAVVYIFLTKG